MTSPPLVLASASPRRTGLLHMLGLEHEVVPTHFSEEPRASETPRAYVERLAHEKAGVVSTRRPEALVLAGDTEVVLDGEVLGKPSDRTQAAAMLLRLSGRTHTVLTALALVTPAGTVHALTDSTLVTFRSLDQDDALAYAATGDPLDKAGGYGIQGLGAALVSRIQGDYYNVVGLPVSGLIRLLHEAGWRYRFGVLVQAEGEPVPSSAAPSFHPMPESR